MKGDTLCEIVFNGRSVEYSLWTLTNLEEVPFRNGNGFFFYVIMFDLSSKTLQTRWKIRTPKTEERHSSNKMLICDYDAKDKQS